MSAGYPSYRLLRAEVEVNGRRRRSLIDTGSTYTLISAQAMVGLARRNDSVLLETVNGGSMRSLGSVLAR